MKILLQIHKCVLFFAIYLIANGSYSQNTRCNYIEYYYQPMYQAYYAYKIQKNNDKAYNILDSLSQQCILLNTPGYYEADIYYELAIKKNKFECAKNIAQLLVKRDGRNWQTLLELGGGKSILDNTEFFVLYNEFELQRDTALIKRLQKMKEDDQIYRQRSVNSKDTKNPALTDSLKKIMAERIDSVHNILLKEIIEVGYPTLAQVGGDYSLFYMPTIFMHMCGYIDYFEPKLFKFVEQGTCPPEILGKMVDRYRLGLPQKDKFLYGIYSNATKEDIYDYPNLNKRRASIGLPPHEMVEIFYNANRLNKE